MLFSDENTIIIASAKPFQINALVYSHGLPKGQMWCHVKRYHSYYPDIVGSHSRAYGSY